MKKIALSFRVFLLGLIFFLIPLVFAPRGIVSYLPMLGGYEQVKVIVLLFLLTIAGCIGKEKATKNVGYHKEDYIFSAGIILLLVSSIFSGDFIPSFFGGGEKYHGTLFYLGLFYFYFLLKKETEHSKNFFTRISLLSLSIVLIYALIQWLGWDMFGGRYQKPFEENRVFSFLGNPNYLSLYFLVLLPVIASFYESKKVQAFFYGVLFFGILVTGSLLGMILITSYIFYKVYEACKKTYFRMFLVIVYIVGIFLSLYFIPGDKLQGLKHREVIWKTTTSSLVSDPKNFLIGHGNEQFLKTFPKFIDTKDTPYFKDSLPDRAHSLYLDIFFQFGLIGFLYSISGIVYLFRSKNHTKESKEALAIFLLFSSMNIVTIAPTIIICLLLAKNNKET